MIVCAKAGFKFWDSSPAAGSAEGTQESSSQCFADTSFFWTKVKVGLHRAACKWISTATNSALQLVLSLAPGVSTNAFFFFFTYIGIILIHPYLSLTYCSALTIASGPKFNYCFPKVVIGSWYMSKKYLRSIYEQTILINKVGNCLLVALGNVPQFS